MKEKRSIITMDGQGNIALPTDTVSIATVSYTHLCHAVCGFGGICFLRSLACYSDYLYHYPHVIDCLFYLFGHHGWGLSLIHI